MSSQETAKEYSIFNEEKVKTAFRRPFIYFFASLKVMCLRSFLLYFLSSILRSTFFLFLRLQYTSPVSLFLSWMSRSCDIYI